MKSVKFKDLKQGNVVQISPCIQAVTCALYDTQTDRSRAEHAQDSKTPKRTCKNTFDWTDITFQ